MTFKRFIAVALSLLLLLGALPEMLPAALATPSTDGCTKSSDGKHAWYPRPRDPWCEISGGLVYICSYCNKEAFEETTPALGHDWGAWKTITEASCTKEGLKARSCNRCGKRETENIGYAHQYGPWETDIPGTCIAKERLVRKCKLCGALDYWTKDYGDHDWDEGVITKAPTATEDGEKTYTCKNDPSHTKTEVIPATGEKKPELTLIWEFDDIRHADKSSDETTTPGVLNPDDGAYAVHAVKNSGNVKLQVIMHSSYGDGYSTAWATKFELEPTEMSASYALGREPVTKHLTPGTETEELLGTVTQTSWAVGYDPDTGAELCKSNEITRTWKVGKDDGPHASLKYEITWDENAGEGKRYEGATVTAYCKTTNTGDCTVYPWPGLYSSFYHVSDAVFPSGISWIEPIGKTAYTVDPGQSWTYTLNIPVRAKDVEQGFIDAMRNDWADYENPKGYVVSADNCEIHIPLTYPDGEEPEEKKPEITLIWDYDIIAHNDGEWFYTISPGILKPNDSAVAFFHYWVSGNIPLNVSVRRAVDIGITTSFKTLYLEPGDIRSDYADCPPVGVYITPGTETDELYGTVTLTVWAVGYDPETGEELCKSNEITRTWKVGKDTGWEIPEDSKLTGTLAVAPGYESSDPAGYQLGEEIETVLTVKNTGLIDLETYGVSDPRDSTSFTDGPIAVSEEKSYVRAHVTVTEEDVERGYIEFPKITISWTDPDSEKERTAFAGPLTVTVLKKTGLLLKKGVAFGPEDGDYFKEGEPIQWSLTVTNNSKDAVTNVTVEDKGKTVGSYTEIAPNDTKNCTVPVHIVTEYDAKVVGYVLNSATATGTDYRGAVHTWPSNVAKALTKKPAVPGEDPKGELDGLHPAITITKAEDPHGPLNGSYYEANEPIKYIITIKNVGDTELKDIAVTDSLAGFAPIGTLPSLAPNEEKTFDYAYTVKEEDIPYCWIYNSATVTYTFGDGIKGTPKTSNTVQSRVGDDPFPPELPHLDPGKLPEGDDWCRLTLDRLGDTKADYTLHACAEHLEAALAAEEAALRSDWTEAAALWRVEVEELYETLYEAADSELKTVLVYEKAAYFDYVDSLTALSAEAAANELRLKCAFLCCALHTTPDDLASSLAGDYAQMMDSEEATASARIFAPLGGSDSAVTETYAGSIAYAQKNVLDLMNIEKSYNWDEVFTRGAQLWTSALDSEVNPIYKAADKDARKLIALWRISLDSLSAAERPFLELLYESNDNAIEETLMNLYKDAALITACIK